MGVNGSFSQCDAHTDRQMSLPEQCSEKAGHMQASQMLVATDALETFLFHEKTKPKCICVLVALSPQTTLAFSYMRQKDSGFLSDRVFHFRYRK